jgi:uncharacterized protein
MSDKIIVERFLGGSLWTNTEGEYQYNQRLLAYYKKIEFDSNQPKWLQSSFATIQLINDNKGIFKEYYESGKLRVEIPFITEGDCYYADGIEKIYYEGFDDVSELSVYILHEENNYVKGVQTGIQRQFYTNGQLMYESLLTQLENLNHQQYYKQYYLNGALKEEVRPEWGKKYYESGELFAIWNSVNYIIVGEYVERHQNGSLKMKVNYTDGNRDGLMYKYFENGKLKELWNYDKGKRKFVKKYFENGNLKTEWLYDGQGNEMSKAYYDKNGNKK